MQGHFATDRLIENHTTAPLRPVTGLPLSIALHPGQSIDQGATRGGAIRAAVCMPPRPTPYVILAKGLGCGK